MILLLQVSAEEQEDVLIYISYISYIFWMYELIVFSRPTLDKNFELLEGADIIKKPISVCIWTSNTMFTLWKGGGPKKLQNSQVE